MIEQLLSAGAETSIENDLGQTVVSMCNTFPELKGMMEKRHRKIRLMNRNVNRSRILSTLTKRNSTATSIQHDMWLISLETMLHLYGDKSKGNVMEVHQELKERGFLTNWRDVPSDAEIVFVSHEWLSWAHPDPQGEQLNVLCHVMEELKLGHLDTEMNPVHTMIYGHKFTVRGHQWEKMLRRTYLWVDWFSMPQPGAEKVEDIGKERMSVLRAEGSRAIRSIPAYVERSDFILILVPSLYHSDRKVPTCYRTWRRRGWCLLELYASAMARDTSNPPLLVRSKRSKPVWMSSSAILTLSIGLADFTCCQRNHEISTETQKIINGTKTKKIPCDKPIAGGILEKLIDAKIRHLFETVKDFVSARFLHVFRHWCMRGLKEDQESTNSLTEFKRELRWRDDKLWFDVGGIGLIIYCVIGNEINVVRELLQCLRQDFTGEEFTLRLESRIPDKVYVGVGIVGGLTALSCAMMFASSDIVSMLLERGANVKSVDMMGNDAFMHASIYGRAKNISFWLEKFKDWNVDRTNVHRGACALGSAVRIIPNKLRTVKVLLNAGARLDFRTFSGGTLLSSAVINEDSNPKVLLLLLRTLKSLHSRERFASIVNDQRKPTSHKWKSIYFIAKTLHRSGLVKSGVMAHLSNEAGTTPLNCAIIRGDLEIVKILLEFGADPDVTNELGMNAFNICEKYGPFPRIQNELEKIKKKGVAHVE